MIWGHPHDLGHLHLIMASSSTVKQWLQIPTQSPMVCADYDPDLCGGVVFEDRSRASPGDKAFFWRGNQRCRMGKNWISLSKIGSLWDFLGISRGQYNQLQSKTLHESILGVRHQSTIIHHKIGHFLWYLLIAQFVKNPNWWCDDHTACTM